MPGSLLSETVGRAAKRVPLLKRVPVLRLLAIGEVAMLAHSHIVRLSPRERRRLVVLLRDARGRPQKLSSSERDELEALIAKVEPKLFAASAAQRLSPIPLPGSIFGRRDA
jgi:hypothetical protein